MLKIENLHVNVDGREILKGLDLELPAGQVHAIMGPNGSGKSTLAYVLAGKENYEVTAGSVTWSPATLRPVALRHPRHTPLNAKANNNPRDRQRSRSSQHAPVPRRRAPHNTRWCRDAALLTARAGAATPATSSPQPAPPPQQAPTTAPRRSSSSP